MSNDILNVKKLIMAVFICFILLIMHNNSYAACTVCDEGNHETCGRGIWVSNGSSLGHEKWCCCQEFQLETTQAHRYTGGDCITRTSCILCGFTGPYGEHDNRAWEAQDANYHVKYCVKCGILTKSDAHSWNTSSPTCILDKECEVCQYVAETATGHIWNISEATYSESKVCTVCGIIGEYASWRNSRTANTPVIVDGMIPVKLNDEDDWESTDKMDAEWYNYEEGKWANAKVEEIYYVWIPRFTYKIEGEEISIKWSDGKYDDTSDGYLSHPAFYFEEYIGGDTGISNNFYQRNGFRNELTGFWIQKDLFAEKTESLASAFEDSKNMYKDDTYGLPKTGTYTHMLKASEWGALAYMTKAKGTLYGSKQSTLNKTGVKIGGSTGTKREYVAGIMGEPSSVTNMVDSSYRRYRDDFSSGLGEFKGYALTETSGLTSTTSFSDDNVLVRGGDLELFGYTSNDGKDKAVGYRTAISIVLEETISPISFFDTEVSVQAGEYLAIGVEFNVSHNNWKFPEEPDKFFTRLDSGSKVVDINCVYESNDPLNKGNAPAWYQTNLNAQVVKLIGPNNELLDVNNTKKYSSGKYTLILKVGGKIGDTPVFEPFEGYDAKIIINEINLLDESGNPLNVGNIPNNKIRLNIFGKPVSSAATGYILLSPPSESVNNYPLDTDISKMKFDGSRLVGFKGESYEKRTKEWDATLNYNYIDQEKTDGINNGKLSKSGKINIELTYNGIPITQIEGNEFYVNVSNTRALNVAVEAKVKDRDFYTVLQSVEYIRGATDVSVPLVASEFLSGYMFENWISNSTNVKAASTNNLATTFIVPRESRVIDRDNVTITANYIAPDRLTVENLKKEFRFNENFSFGEGSVITATYDNGRKSRKIGIETSGINVSIKTKTGDKSIGLEKLLAGKYDVTIEYAGVTYSYEISVNLPVE